MTRDFEHDDPATRLTRRAAQGRPQYSWAVVVATCVLSAVVTLAVTFTWLWLVADDRCECERTSLEQATPRTGLIVPVRVFEDGAGVLPRGTRNGVLGDLSGRGFCLSGELCEDTGTPAG